MKKVIVILSFISGFFIYSEISFAQNTVKAKLVKVDLSPNKPTHKLYPLTILSIDGEPVTRRNHFIMLEPGIHKLKFSSNVAFSNFTGNDRILRTKINQRKYGDTLELKVEANNQYQLAFDARPRKVEDWKPILLSFSNLENK
jgi:hypothetical protein